MNLEEHFDKWKERRFWLYTPDKFESYEYKKEDFQTTLHKKMLNNEEVKREIMWDNLIENLLKNKWKDVGKMFFQSPYDNEKYDIRDALIIEQSKV